MDEIPEGWKEEKLGLLLKTTSGGTPSRSIKSYYNGNIPWLKSGELNDNVHILDSEEHITQEALENSSAKLFPANTVLIAMYGATTGKIGIIKFPCSTNQAICGILPNTNFISEFIYYFLLFKRQYLIELGKGGAQPNISQTVIKSMDFPKIPKEEQKVITREIEKQFSRLDEAIKSLKSTKDKLQAYRKSILKAAFEGKIIDTKFEKQTIKQISKSIIYGTSKKAKKTGKIPVLRMGNLQNGKIDYSRLKFFDGGLDIEKLVLEKEDILFNRTNSSELVGKTSIYNGNSQYHKVTFASYLIRIRVDKQLIIPKYLNYWLNSPQAAMIKDKLKSQQVGQANINGTKLKNINFPYVEDLEIQEQIVQEIESSFSVIDKLEETVYQSLEKTEKLRKSILKSAFEGKLVRYEEN